jgi:tetrapyrrole methylase family protein / MazG family protein
MPQPPKTLNKIESLLQVIADLRGPEGCPWDKEQDHKTLAPYAIEETHEMVEAIEAGDDSEMCDELGDVLFQVVLHAQLASERKAFNFSSVVEAITGKIVRRHPHVFSDVKVSGIDEVFKNWDEIKKLEKAGKPSAGAKPVIDVPASLPALQRANKIGEKTAKYKFDWSKASEVVAQLKAEIVELEEAMAETSSSERASHIQHEMGDVLFSAAQLARHLEVDPEASLRDSNRRFIARFEKMLSLRGLDGAAFTALAEPEKEKLWTEAKAALAAE